MCKNCGSCLRNDFLNNFKDSYVNHFYNRRTHLLQGISRAQVFAQTPRNREVKILDIPTMQSA